MHTSAPPGDDPGMRIHHLNCGTMTPVLGPLLRMRHEPATAAHMVCHVLLIETDQGLVLVDSGLGLADVANARQRLGGVFLQVVRPVLQEADTAHRQIKRLGFDPNDVRHIVLTHLDLDHAGGIADFPQAKIHVLAGEYEAAHAARSLSERNRYRHSQWSHSPDWSLHHAEGEPWHGFAAARGLEGLPPEILLIPLTGHTRGHAGVAVDTGNGWLLHAGDAYFHHGQMAAHPVCPVGLQVFQRLMCEQEPKRRDNLERLQQLATDTDAGVRVFCAHDPSDLHALADTR